MENAVKIQKLICKTKIAIIFVTKKNRLDPNFEQRLYFVANVETHRYSPFLSPGEHVWQSYKEHRV
jgi:hypothetical protein